MSDDLYLFGDLFPYYPVTRVRGNYMRFTWTNIFAPTIPGWALYDLQESPSPSMPYKRHCIYKKVDSD